MSDIQEEVANKIEEDKAKIAEMLNEATEEARKKIKDDVETMFDLMYADYLPWLTSDLYSNLFAKYNDWIVSNFRDANQVFGGSTAKYLRQRIYQENREEIIKLLDQDNLDKIKSLEEQNHRLQEQLRDRY